MKKIISIIAILFCFATLYAQDTKPTKQETMDWIAEKIKNNINPNTNIFTENGQIWMYFDFKFITYLNSTVTIQKKTQFRFEDGTRGEEKIETIRIDLSKVNSYVSSEKEFTLKGETLVSETKNNETKNLNSISLFALLKNGDQVNLTVMDKDLFVRFIKAIDELIIYNSKEKKKEAY